MRRIVHIGAVVATTAAIVPALAGFTPAQAPVATAADEEGTENAPLVVEEITPKSIGDDSRIRIRGEVTNTTGSRIDEVTVRFSYSAYAFDERSELGEFTSGDGVRPGIEAAEVELDEPLAPGDSAEYTLRADAAELSLSSWGVYPLVVEASDGSGGEIGRQRTFLPYRGGSAPETLDIAWVWPLMDRPQRADEDTFLGDSLTRSLGPDGRLGRLLTIGAQDERVSLEPEDPAEETSPSPLTPSQTPSETPSAAASAAAEDASATAGADSQAGAQDGSQRGPSDEDTGVPLTWVVDPGLLADIDRLTSPHRLVEEPRSATGSGQGAGGAAEDDAGIATTSAQASPEAGIWLDQARAALAEDSLAAAPYASADIAALLRHGLSDDADASVELGREAVERVLQRTADETVAVPRGGLLNTPTREFYQRHGASTFLLREAAMPAESGLGYTPTAQAPVSLGKGEKGTALVADSGLAQVLRQEADGPGEAALAQQRFAAETAMIAAESPGTPRTLLAYPPADWNPSADFARGLLDSSRSLPWLDPVELAGVEPDDSSSGDARKDLVYPERATRSELDKSYLEKVKDVRSRVRLFNSVLVDGEDPFRPAILRLESAAWRREDDLSSPARALVRQAVERDMDKVHIIPTEPVTLASTTGTIAVLIANDLQDQTVRVNLSMLSGNPERLSIGNYQDAIEIGPGGKTTVYVELTARVNGRTMIQMNLHNLNGEPISDEQYLPVHATGMGMQALVISGLGALVLVVALAPRALRKWARNRAGGAAATAAAGPPGGEGDDEDGGDRGTTGSPEPADDRGGAQGEWSGPDAGMQHNEEGSASAPPTGSGSDSPSAPPAQGEDSSGGTGAER
ncbi:DUF6049 family protein [Streptomonospora litoralis]|uniref:Secreted protein n=1 Tax=Streptomonospora litoralis TaxID=2498135 RepID=A0A4P6Q7F4_9ACTN|nr:DUF6049 family protein [Streptomonospora litoralis]QBI56728.1 hypothetical protein EKD16_24935 [Streptomonospora litoralis]